MTHIFRIEALADPQTLPRIAGIFAQRSLIPALMACDLRGDRLHIEVQLDGLDPAMAAIIAAKLDEAVLVASATCHPADNGSGGRGRGADADHPRGGVTAAKVGDEENAVLGSKRTKPDEAGVPT